MREFIKMFFWGMAWFFAPFIVFAIALVLFVAYGFQALIFIAMIISGFFWLVSRDAEMAHAFFYFGAISVVLCGPSVAFLGQVHKLFRAARARTTPIPRYEVYLPSNDPFE